MTITISISELLSDIKTKSRLETDGIADADMKYRVQVGSEKNDEIYRDLTSSHASVRRVMRRFLQKDYSDSDNNELPVPYMTDFTYVLAFADRRLANKVQPLTDKIHDYLVHLTLSKFYASVSAGELSNAHSMLTIDAANQIEDLLYSKDSPL